MCLIRFGGGSSGFAEYLEHGRKQGRLEHRDDLDQRIKLHGNLADFERIVDGMPNRVTEKTQADGSIKKVPAQKYIHATLSFAEHNLSNEKLQAITNEFVEFLTTAYQVKDEIGIYAEAHVPRLQQAIDQKTSDVYQRLTHIHVGIPQVNLVTGTREDPLGMHRQRMMYVDAFQEHINQKYGLLSPKDSPRSFGNTAWILERMKGDDYRGLVSAAELKTGVADLAKKAGSYEDFSKQLAEFGDVKPRNEGKLNEYLWFRAKNRDEGVNLREMQFRPSYFEKPVGERALPSDPDKYRSVGEGREVDEKYTKILEQWKEYGALQMRFAPGGRQSRLKITKDMPAGELLAILKDREQKFYTKHADRFIELENGGYDYRNGRFGRTIGIDRELGHDRDQSSRGIEDIPSEAARALASGRADRDGSGSGPKIGPLPDLYESGARAGRSDAAGALLPGDVQGHQSDDHQVHGMAGRGSGADRTGTGQSSEGEIGLTSLISKLKSVGVEQFAHAFEGESSEIGQMGHDLIESLRRKEADPRISEIKAGLEPERLLAALAESHRLNTKLYKVEGQRIIAGRTALTVNDFLTKEIHLDWPQAEAILHQTWDQQQRQEPYREPEQAQVTDRELWDHYRVWKTQQIESSKVERKTIIEQQSRILGQIREKGRIERQEIKDGATRGREGYADRQHALSVSRMGQILAEQQIRAQTAQKRDATFSHEIGFREFLFDRANQGDLIAFERLRRMAPEVVERVEGFDTMTGQDHHPRFTKDGKPAEPMLSADYKAKFQLTAQVDRQTADVRYLNDVGELVIIDQRNAVTSRIEDDETIAIQLGLAVMKFGKENLRLNGSDSFIDSIIRKAASEKAYVGLSFENALHQTQLEQYRQQFSTREPVEPIQIDGATAAEIKQQLIDMAYEKASVATSRDIDRLVDSVRVEPSIKEEIRAGLAKDLIEVGSDEYGRALFTSSVVLEREKGMVADAKALANSNRHGLSDAQVKAAIRQKEQTTAAKIGKPVTMSDEQAAAVRHALQAGDLSIIQGSAGAGKSFAMESVRIGYEDAGYQVYGCAISRKAAQNLQDEAGIGSRTVARMLIDLDNKKLEINHRSVIVLDEAGLAGVSDMSRLLKHTNEAGAKIILTGEDRQLDAIQHGGALRYLSTPEIVGTARVMTIQRQNEQWARDAVANLRDGNADAAYKAFDERGLIHNVEGGTTKALKAMVDEWDADRKANPDKQGLLLAHKNSDVRALSHMVRGIYQDEGKLTGPEYKVAATAGEQSYTLPLMAGERIRFNLNSDKIGNGVINGTLGTVEEIKPIADGKDYQLFVKTDDRGLVNFKLSDYRAENGRVPLSHAYAMTIYSSQGLTIDGKVYMLASPSMDRALAYVGASRSKYGTVTFVDVDAFKALATKHNAPIRDMVIKSWSNDRGRKLALEVLNGPATELIKKQQSVDTLVSHGPAPYLHKEGEKPSYFVTTANEAGKEKTHWGVDLRRAVEDAKVVPGDQIQLNKLGKQNVVVQVAERDANGTKTGREVPREVERVTWNVEKVGAGKGPQDQAKQQTPQKPAMDPGKQPAAAGLQTKAPQAQQRLGGTTKATESNIALRDAVKDLAKTQQPAKPKLAEPAQQQPKQPISGQQTKTPEPKPSVQKRQEVAPSPRLQKVVKEPVAPAQKIVQTPTPPSSNRGPKR